MTEYKLPSDAETLSSFDKVVSEAKEKRRKVLNAVKKRRRHYVKQAPNVPTSEWDSA